MNEGLNQHIKIRTIACNRGTNAMAIVSPNPGHTSKKYSPAIQNARQHFDVTKIPYLIKFRLPHTFIRGSRLGFTGGDSFPCFRGF